MKQLNQNQLSGGRPRKEEMQAEKGSPDTNEQFKAQVSFIINFFGLFLKAQVF